MANNEQFMPEEKCTRKVIIPKNNKHIDGLMRYYYGRLAALQQDFACSAIALADIKTVLSPAYRTDPIDAPITGADICDGCLRRMKRELTDLDRTIDDLLKFHAENEGREIF